MILLYLCKMLLIGGFRGLKVTVNGISSPFFSVSSSLGFNKVSLSLVAAFAIACLTT